MSFLRHAGIYRSDVILKTITTWGGAPPPDGRPPAPVQGRDGRNYAPCSSSAMSSRAGYSLAGCSPAEPASASPTASSMGWGITAGNELSANGNLSLVSVSQPRGSLQAPAGAIISFEVGGNNSRNFRTMPTSLPTWKPRSLQLAAIPLEGVEASIVKRGSADC
jgi:hypothetical protein